jgi:capsular polysaccharide transport system ATP-binding protein
MIRLTSVEKAYHIRGAPPRRVLDDVSIEFPTGVNVGVLGLNGAGKSTLIRLLSGAEKPDKGTIERSGIVSFPLGFASIFHPDLTGRENIRFLAKIYNINTSDIFRYVQWFADLGYYFDLPVKSYSSGMLAKVAFAACLAIEFDTYLVDEITEVGDGIFREKAALEFRRRASRSDMILVSHNADTIREYCDKGAVIHHGSIEMFDSVQDALRRFSEICHDASSMNEIK